MKNYYQQKKGGWKLDPAIYARTVSLIRCYRIYCQQADAGIAGDAGVAWDAGTAGDAGNGEKDLTHSRRTAHRTAVQDYVRIIDQALADYVPEAYRAAVFSHVVDRTTYNELEERYFISASTMKRYSQVFIWGVARGLGEIFPEDPQDD